MMNTRWWWCCQRKRVFLGQGELGIVCKCGLPLEIEAWLEAARRSLLPISRQLPTYCLPVGFYGSKHSRTLVVVLLVVVLVSPLLDCDKAGESACED